MLTLLLILAGFLAGILITPFLFGLVVFCLGRWW